MTNKICKCGHEKAIWDSIYGHKPPHRNCPCRKFEPQHFESTQMHKIEYKPKNHKEVGRTIIKEVFSKKVDEAWEFAKEKHEGQKDDMGKDYFETHCFVVYTILKEVTNNENILSAGLLHDTLEDTNTSYEELKEKFGQKIADLVNEVTHEGQKDKTGFYFPRLHSKEAIMIKFADRLSNISRMENWNDKRKAQYLRKSKFWGSEEK